MAGADAGRSPSGGAGTEEPLRIEAGPRERRLATAAQCGLVALILALVWSGGRVVGLIWPERADPEVGFALWLFVGTLSCAALTLAWLVVLLQDLVKMTIELGPEGLAVDRWLVPFRVRWDEVREVGVSPPCGHLTLRTARGSLTATSRLLGASAFAALLAGIRRHAEPAVREWTPWAAARRQLVVFAVPAIGMAFLLIVGQGIWRRRLPRLGRGGRTR
jgi:hypothetical protein